MQRLRPLAVTDVVAVASVGLLVLAVGLGWLGPDVGFVIAGLLIAARVDAAFVMPELAPRLLGLAPRDLQDSHDRGDHRRRRLRGHGRRARRRGDPREVLT